MDRRTKAQFKLKVREALLDFIYAPVVKRNELRLKGLIDENDALVGVNITGSSTVINFTRSRGMQGRRKTYPACLAVFMLGWTKFSTKNASLSVKNAP